MIIIKPTKRMIIHLIWPNIIILVLSILFYIKFKVLIVAFVPMGVLLCLMPWFISSLRTFVFDETGCTVCLWKYKRHYRWDEFQLKQEVQYKGFIIKTTNGWNFKAIELHHKKIKIPKYIDGHVYSSIFHPLSFIFVYFPDVNNPFPVAYTANENQFKKKLDEWNVSLEHSERGACAYNSTWQPPRWK